MAEDLCSIAVSLKKECNLLVFTRLVGRYQIEGLPEKDRTLINIQTLKKNSPYNLIFAIIMKRNILVDTKQPKNIVQTLLNFMMNGSLKIGELLI